MLTSAGGEGLGLGVGGDGVGEGLGGLSPQLSALTKGMGPTLPLGLVKSPSVGTHRVVS